MNWWAGQNFCDRYSKVVKKPQNKREVMRAMCAPEIIKNRKALMTRLQGLTSYTEREHSINIWHFTAVRRVFNLLHRREDVHEGCGVGGGALVWR